MFIDWIKAIIGGSMGGLGVLIFLGIVIVGTIVVAVSMRKKVLYGFLALALGFFIYAKCTCGPSFSDVRVMYPMAEKISDYIVKNGIPKSLKDIPDLPYEFVGCANKQTYYKFDHKVFTNIEVSLKKNAEFEVKDITCHFTNKKRHYFISIDGTYEFKNSGSLMLEIKNDNSKTGIQYAFIINNKGQIYIDHKGNPYSSKTSGICNPMRQ